MPSISKIRLTNVVYEEGKKRYNDEIFLFDGNNGAILLENGGGKTVFIQTALQAILPHTSLADRKIRDTLLLEHAPAHVAIEWLMNDNPRRYVTTSVSLYVTKNGLDSLRYVYEYDAGDAHRIEEIPFVRETNGKKRPAERGEMLDYYSLMKDKLFRARTFSTIKEYKEFIEEQYHIISSEWESVVKINSSEGGVEVFFDECKSTNQLFDRLLIPTVEASIAGHDPNLFADMFEKQRESFQVYKKLRESIRENEQIQEELERYVRHYEKLHQCERSYLQGKAEAKGTWNLILEQQRHASNELAAVNESWNEWEETNRLHALKKASYEMFVEELAFRQLEEVYKHILSELEEQEEALQTNERSYYSLKLARMAKERQEHEQRLKYIQEQLSELHQSEELVDYEEKMEQTKRALLGYFYEKIERLEQTKKDISFELRPIEDRLTELQKELEAKEKEASEKQKQLSSIQGKRETRESDVGQLKQELLSNPDQEEVKKELSKWNARVQYLDDEMIRLHQEAKMLMAAITQAGEQRAAFIEERTNVVQEKERLFYQHTLLKEAHEKVIGKLTAIRPQWASIDSIYLKEETVKTRLLAELEKEKKEKEELLYKERLAYRFIDQYGGQETFFSDPFLEQQLKSWKNQFDFVTTGVEFWQKMSEEERERNKHFTLWPLTVITTSKSKQRLMEKVRHIADRLQFPIFLLTTDEIARIGQEQTDVSWIAPLHWEGNLDISAFESWKKQLVGNANRITESRKGKERDIQRKEETLADFYAFLEQYPHEKEVELVDAIRSLTNEIEQLTMKIQAEQQVEQDLNSKLDTVRANAKGYGEEKTGLEEKVQRAIRYLQYEHELTELWRQELSLQGALNMMVEEKKELFVQVKRFEEEKEDRVTRQRELDFYLEQTRQDETFKTVQAFTPLYTGEERTIIEDRLKEFEYKLRQIDTTVGEWKAKQAGEEQAIRSINGQMEDLLREREDVEQNRMFPPDGDHLLEVMRATMIELGKKVQTLQKEEADKKSKRDIQNGIWKAKVELFQKNFPKADPVSFTQPAHEIEAMLAVEQKSLNERHTFLKQEQERIQKEKTAIEEAERELDRFVEGHHFNAPDIIGVTFNPEKATAFTYNRQAFVKQVTERLKDQKEKVEYEKEQVNRAKRYFREFCNQTITDVKMRNMALNGVEHKQTYEDIVQFKNNMMTSVERVTRYANEHIRQKDVELQAFINQIHSHLQTLAEELKHIPKKTKVKAEDEWKQIFIFSIPEWEEEAGKNRIRDHIEWIVKQLESERFKNDRGEEDFGKIRKEVERWLQSKQLLQIVMNNEVMKVNCRKVTNDNKVTTRSYSWEQSNVWSGGEKWSKNMTLFLGILNYVAEKKQHIQPNIKRHRAVILDNPFGKASSDHVLSPVFFVAEQLGFQIIALTAHAEGKFLQDYFPIIYSCRLRTSADASKQVMTKEKWLHHAYFQDHEPQSMERLGEIEQMVLFE